MDIAKTLAEATFELVQIDAILARRPALADCTTRAEKIEKAINVAKRVDQLEADATPPTQREIDMRYIKLLEEQNAKMKAALEQVVSPLRPNGREVLQQAADALAFCK
jgi:hypothetical protein